MSLFPINTFDAVFAVAIIFGIYRGSKTDALPQIFGFCRWTLILVICSFLYAAPARWLSKFSYMQPDVVGLIIYPVELAVVWLVYEFICYRFEHKLEKKKLFGRSENFVAMLAGAARFFVILLTAMAWLSGKYVTEKDLRNNEESFCDYFISTIHNDVFHGSLSGRLAKEYLKPVLMTAAPRVDYGDRPESKPAAARTVHLKELDLGYDKTNNAVMTMVDPKETPAAETPQTSGSKEIIYHNLTLRGIIINSAKKRFALINNQTFHEGEFADVKIENKAINLHCLGIMDGEVNVRITGRTNVIALKMNVMTDLNGEPVTPPKPVLTPKH